MSKPKLNPLAMVSLLMLALLACQISINPGSNTEKIVFPTAIVATQAGGNEQPQVVQPTQTIDTGPALTLTPSATPLPCNKPKFQYETIPDNSAFDPGESFLKTWTVRNDGTCTWDSSYRFVFMEGNQMGGPSSIGLPKVVAPGDTVTLSINLTAPAANGSYTGTWRLKSGSGETFGNYWAKIIVGTPPAAFAVTSVTVSAEHVNIEGTCPQSFHLGADITTNGAGNVSFWFMRSDGSISAASTINFAAAGTKFVTSSWSLGATGNYWAKLYIDNPNHQEFGQVNLHLTCTP